MSCSLLLSVVLPLLAGAAPPVLRVGTDNSAPFHSIDSSGKAQGIAVAVLEEAARRRGIQLEWVYRPGPDPLVHLQNRTVDLWPLHRPVSGPHVHATYSWLQSPGLRVEGGGAGGVTVGAEGVRAVCAGRSAAALVDLAVLRRLALDGSAGCDLARLRLHRTEEPAALATLSTRRAGPQAEALREEIDKMSSDGTLARILAPWVYFIGTEQESAFRELTVRRYLATSMLAFLAAAGGCLVLLAVVYRNRRHHARQLAGIGRELRALLDTPSPAVLLDQVAAAARPFAAQRGVALHVEGAETLPPLPLPDASRLRESLTAQVRQAISETTTGQVTLHAACVVQAGKPEIRLEPEQAVSGSLANLDWATRQGKSPVAPAKEEIESPPSGQLP